jgi:hypothetical protein
MDDRVGPLNVDLVGGCNAAPLPAVTSTTTCGPFVYEFAGHGSELTDFSAFSSPVRSKPQESASQEARLTDAQSLRFHGLKCHGTSMITIL